MNLYLRCTRTTVNAYWFITRVLLSHTFRSLITGCTNTYKTIIKIHTSSAIATRGIVETIVHICSAFDVICTIWKCVTPAVFATAGPGACTGVAANLIDAGAFDRRLNALIYCKKCFLVLLKCYIG